MVSNEDSIVAIMQNGTAVIVNAAAPACVLLRSETDCRTAYSRGIRDRRRLWGPLQTFTSYFPNTQFKSISLGNSFACGTSLCGWNAARAAV